MNIEQEILRLKALFKNADANASEIIRVYYNMVKERNCDSNVIHFLNHTGAQLLSSDVTNVLRKYRLEAFSYILIANNLLNLEDVKDDLLNGNVFMENTPSNTVRKLQRELRLGTVASPVQSSAKKPIEHGTMIVNTMARTNKDIKSKFHFTPKKSSEIIVNKVPLKRAVFFWNLFHRQRISIPKPIAITRQFKTTRRMGRMNKTTTTNAVTGIKMEDGFNFLFIDEVLQKISQVFCQTRGVIAYDIHYRDGFRTPYSLTIVDKLADCGERGNEIISKLKYLLQQKHGTIPTVCVLNNFTNYL